MSAVPCVRCGLEFYRPKVTAGKGCPTTCEDCRTVPLPPRVHGRRGQGQGRVTPVLVTTLAGRVADLRIALEMARRRLGMGIDGSRIGMDTLADSTREADDIMARALAAYAELAGAA